MPALLRIFVAALVALSLVAAPASASQLTINVGSAPNDATGDTLRTGFFFFYS